MTTRSKLTVAFLLAACFLPLTSEAASKKVKPKAVMAEAKNISKDIKKLQKLFNRLSEADKLKVIDLLQSKNTLADSDGDGISDILEDDFGSDICNNDSDDDGVNDGDEVEDGNDPADGDSDDDGVSDGLEAHAHGAVSEVSGDHFVIDGVEFVLGDGSVFDDGLAPEDIVVGACLRVEGHREVADGEAIVDEVGAEDGCGSPPN